MNQFEPEFIKSISNPLNQYLSVKTDSVIFRKYNNNKIEEYHKDYYTVNGNNFIVAIVIKDDHILVIKQYRIPLKSINTEFVAGNIEKDETPEQAVQKELLEEAGIKCFNMKLLGKFYPLCGFTSNQAYVYLIDCFEEQEQQLETLEDFSNLTKHWIPIKEFKNLIKNNVINDGVTLMSWAIFCESSF